MIEATKPKSAGAARRPRRINQSDFHDPDTRATASTENHPMRECREHWVRSWVPSVGPNPRRFAPIQKELGGKQPHPLHCRGSKPCFRLFKSALTSKTEGIIRKRCQKGTGDCDPSGRCGSKTTYVLIRTLYPYPLNATPRPNTFVTVWWERKGFPPSHSRYRVIRRL